MIPLNPTIGMWQLWVNCALRRLLLATPDSELVRAENIPQLSFLVEDMSSILRRIRSSSHCIPGTLPFNPHQSLGFIETGLMHPSVPEVHDPDSTNN
jgi:hypothetical protein